MTIYVVTSGGYSDYVIVAIFDDKALADAYCEGSDDADGDGMRVEEYPINPHADLIRQSLQTHTVELWRDGSLRSHSASYGADPKAGGVVKRWESGGLSRYAFVASVLAKSREQAIKAVNEQRAIYIAANRPWPDDVIRDVPSFWIRGDAVSMAGSVSTLVILVKERT